MSRRFSFTLRRHPLSWMRYVCVTVTLCLSACAVGPDYRRPAIDIPMSFKEGVQWERAQAAPPAALSDQWWTLYRDEQLSGYVTQALTQNQSIIAAEALTAGHKPRWRAPRPVCSPL